MVAHSDKKNTELKEEFSLALLDFYKEYIKNTSSTVKTLSELQKKYKDLYDEFIEFQKDPSSLIETAKNMETETQAILFFIFAKIAVLSSKMMRVFELNVEQQEKLSKELEQFIIDIDTSLEKLKKIKEGS